MASSVTDADAVQKAYEVYTEVLRSEAAAESSRPTSVGVLKARSAATEAAGRRQVEMRLFRNGRADVVTPITTLSSWASLRRTEVMPEVPPDLG